MKVAVSMIRLVTFEFDGILSKNVDLAQDAQCFPQSILIQRLTVARISTCDAVITAFL